MPYPLDIIPEFINPIVNSKESTRRGPDFGYPHRGFALLEFH